MGYFNISSILYNLRKIFKYLSISLIVVAFIVVCLLLMGKSSFALTFEYDNTTHNLADFTEASRYYIGYDNGSYFLWAIMDDSPENSYFYLNGQYIWIYGRCYLYNYVNGQWVNANTFISYNSMGLPAHVIYSTVDIYTDVTKASVWFPASSPYTAPYISMPNDSTANYISGEFSDFLVYGGENVSELYFYYGFYDDDNEYTDYVYLTLNHDSPYYLNNFPNANMYVIPKNILPSGYLNEHTYLMYLSYTANGSHFNSGWITWTTDFSALAIQNDEIREQQRINNELNNISGFLNNNNYNSSDITDNMPNSDNYNSPTDQGIDNIFTALYNAFTSTTPQNLRFVIPFSNNQYIDIPSDLVTSKLPSVILIMIQSVYWYIICRFIIKDISKTAEKAKSGDILEGSTDGNIKTDLL